MILEDGGRVLYLPGKREWQWAEKSFHRTTFLFRLLRFGFGENCSSRSLVPPLLGLTCVRTKNA